MSQKSNRLLPQRKRSTHAVDGSFRRNTLVTSKSQREVALHKQTVTQRQYDRKKVVRRRKVRLQFLAVGVVVFLILAGWRLGITHVSLKLVDRPMVSQEDKSQYEKGIQEAMSEATFGRQVWLLDKQQLEADIKQKYPEIAQISFTSQAPFATGLEAEVRFRDPVFIWQDVSQVQQYIDSQGVLFAINRSATTDVNKLTHIEDESGVVLDPGTSVLGVNLIQSIGQLPTKLPEAFGDPSLKIERVVIPTSTREIQVKVAGQPYLIRLSSERDFDEQIRELQTVLAYLKSKNISPGGVVDIRIPHKVFYK